MEHQDLNKKALNLYWWTKRNTRLEHFASTYTHTWSYLTSTTTWGVQLFPKLLSLAWLLASLGRLFANELSTPLYTWGLATWMDRIVPLVIILPHMKLLDPSLNHSRNLYNSCILLLSLDTPHKFTPLPDIWHYSLDFYKRPHISTLLYKTIISINLLENLTTLAPCWVFLNIGTFST